MKVILEKDGQQVSYKAGSALYMLLSFIPFGGIITLVLNIVYKQFRGIWLNQLIVTLITLVLVIVAAVIGSDALIVIAYILMLVSLIYLYVMYVFNANHYSVKQRLEEGYTVVNLDEAGISEFVEVAKAKKTPICQITKF